MISIVIPLYNKEKSIYATLQSVCSQTYTDFEVIIVDDGSTDESAATAASYRDSRIRIICKENGGVCSARNRGIQEAKGEYIALLDGDDQWDKMYLEEQVKMIHDFPDAAMWGINFAELNNGKLIRKLETGLPDGYRGYVENYFEMKGRVSDLFCSSSVVIRKEIFGKVGMFDERIKYAEDTDMWWRIIATNKVAFYDRYMVFYQYDAENRAMRRTRQLKYFLPYYVEKYQAPIFRSNNMFYRYVNCWAAQQIRSYFFSDNDKDRDDAKVAVRKIDYIVIPLKYRLLYKWPYFMAKLFNKLDKLYHRQ